MRRVWIGLLAALLAFGAADTLAWVWATRLLAARYTAWTRAQRTAGWSVRSGPPVRGGWPFSAVLAIPQPELSRPAVMGMPGPVSWQAERLTLRLPLRYPPRLVVQPDGAQVARLPLGPPIHYRAARLALDVRLSLSGRPRAARLVLRDLTAAAGATPHWLRIGFAQLRLDRAVGPPAVQFALTARAIDLPRGRAWPLGPRIATFAGHGVVDGELPETGTLRQRARAWQRAGGRLRLQQMALRWGPLTASLDATLGLDSELRPEGQGQAMASGYDQALDTLAANHAVSNDGVVAAKAVLSLLAAAPDPHAPGTVAIPFTLQAGRLSADGLPLLRLPSLGDSWVPR